MTEGTYQVVRTDDHGNRFTVASKLTKPEAEALMAKMQGHKQFYEIEGPEMNTEDAAEQARVRSNEDAAMLREMIVQSMGGFTEEQLRAAMEKVQNPTNWKYPIDAVIDRRDLDVTVKAVEFFTGSKLEIAEDLGPKLRVTAIGYYAAVGA